MSLPLSRRPAFFNTGFNRADLQKTAAHLAAVWLIVVFFRFGMPGVVHADASGPVAGTAFAALFATILVSAFGVVRQADRLASVLGDPYGTLVLTFSIVAIEIVLISAVSLGPGDAAGIGRDSIFALLMIALNLVMGVCLIAGGIHNGEQDYNAQGAISYLSLVTVLTITARAG